MKSQDLKKYKIPDSPGVYFFLGARGKILYIGKAGSLATRVRSYFSRDIERSRGPLILQMTELATGLKFTKTDSVLEALILETSLIKKHRPKYNTKEKDDKSHNYIIITDESFPRVLIVRSREIDGGKFNYKIKASFGPFPQGSVLKDALKIIRKIFPFRDKCKPLDLSKKSKPCFDRQIGLCPGVCVGEISKKEYSKTISNIRMFLSGRKVALVKKLEMEMNALSKSQEFERANILKRQIFALKHIQDIALMNNRDSSGTREGGGIRIEGIDIAHTSGKASVGVVVVSEMGSLKKSDYRKFKIKSVNGVDDTGSIREVLERRLAHSEWEYPKLFVIDGGKAQKNIAEKVLKEHGTDISVVSVVKDERHKPREILGKKDLIKKYEKEILLLNGEAHRFAVSYHRKLRDKIK